MKSIRWGERKYFYVRVETGLPGDTSIKINRERERAISESRSFLANGSVAGGVAVGV